MARNGCRPSARAGTTDADTVVRALDGHTFTDMFAHNAEFRAADHAVIHDLAIVQVLPSDQIAEPHAWFKVLATVSATTAFPPHQDCRIALVSSAAAKPSFAALATIMV